MELPFPRPLSEIGYTSSPRLRMKQHQAHVSSNAAMNLLGAIAIHHYDGRYRWIYQPIARVRTYLWATALELFFSRLCQSYSWLGDFQCTMNWRFWYLVQIFKSALPFPSTSLFLFPPILPDMKSIVELPKQFVKLQSVYLWSSIWKGPSQHQSNFLEGRLFWIYLKLR